MAIGSAIPAGVVFARWGDMDARERKAWYDFVRTDWHPNLMNGFGTLIEIDRTAETPTEARTR
jgi:hypothetical protein